LSNGEVRTSASIGLARKTTAVLLVVCAAATSSCSKHLNADEAVASEIAVAAPAPVESAAGTNAATPRGAVEAGNDNKCMPATELPVPPRKVRDRRPSWSEVRNIRTRGGTLVYEITIGTSGKVTDVRRVNRKRARSPAPRLADLWRRAIQDWQFEPTALNGTPVAVCMTVTVTIDI
jgi:outer membrane biosynthesis protein TonB